MGLFGTEITRNEENNYYLSPDKIDVTIHEHKAVTDEAVKYMEDAHNKAMENIIAKVKVEDNIINGEVFLINQPWNINDLKVICKFKINGKDYVAEKEIDRSLWMYGNEYRNISLLQEKLKDGGKAIMLWYLLKQFSADQYKAIIGHDIDFNFFVKQK